MCIPAGSLNHHFRSNCLSAGLEMTRSLIKKLMNCHICLLSSLRQCSTFFLDAFCAPSLPNGKTLKSLTEVCCNGFVPGLLGEFEFKNLSNIPPFYCDCKWIPSLSCIYSGKEDCRGLKSHKSLC